MAELELTKVVEGIEALFSDSNRFVFWYDETGDFRNNIPEISSRLTHQVIVMNARDQFKTKLQLTTMERRGESALVYSPAPQPPLAENLMADFLRYNKTYAADALTMLQEELNLKPSDRAFLQQYATFFANKERKKRFEDLNYNHQPLEMVLLAAIAKASTPALGAVLQVICSGSLNEDNETLTLFAKYGALDAFWEFVEVAYGFQNTHRTPLHLFAAMLLNMAYDQAELPLPIELNAYALRGVNNAITFIQNTRNMISGQNWIRRVATEVWNLIKGQSLFGKVDIARLVKVDAFPQIDNIVARWVTDRILSDDLDTRVNRQSLAATVSARQTMAYGYLWSSIYEIQQNALALLSKNRFDEPENLPEAIERYVTEDYQMDTYYRKFTVAYSMVAPQLEATVEGIQSKVENVYLNEFLSESIRNWTQLYKADQVPSNLYQRNFYQQFVSVDSDRTVVLISDAFRFEAAKALQAQLETQDVVSTEMRHLVTGLPSVTYFGMPALLPNHRLEYDGARSVLVDGQLVTSTDKRQQVLQQVNSASVAGLVSDFNAMNSEQRKSFIAGQKVVYLYDNRVDTTGEKAVTEQEVFAATQRAIDNLVRTIEILRNLSVRHIILTADHGYIYRHSALDSANKIEVDTHTFESIGGIKKEQRYLISAHPLTVPGTANQVLGQAMGNDDTRYVSYPKNFDIFQSYGASQNYVHGGCSAQEMIVPVLDIRTSKGRSQAEPAKLHDVTAGRRITAREVTVQLMQDDPISDLVTPSTYQVYFVSDAGELISGVVDITVNSRETMPTDRIQRVRLTLKDSKFANGRQHALVIRNVETEEETRTAYTMDLVIGGGFGFDI